MKPLIILSIIAVLCGAGCKTNEPFPNKEEAEQAYNNSLERLGKLRVATPVQPLPEEERVFASNILPKPPAESLMVAVQLKTPIIIKGELINNGAWNCRHTNIEDCAKQANEKYPDSVQTTTQIPLQEFVDLLHLYYVPATSTTSNQPAKLVK